MAVGNRAAGVSRAAIREGCRGIGCCLKQDVEHLDRVANVVVPTEIHITGIAAGRWWARCEEAVQVINHIGNVEGHVVVAITANKLGTTGRIAANVLAACCKFM